VTEERDSRIKKKIFPISTFILSFLVFALITTIEMKIIGNYIDSAEIPKKLIVGIFIFWMLGAAFFTYFTNWQLRKKYQEPLEKVSIAAKKVAEGDFSVYLKAQHTKDKADCLDILVEDFNKMVEELGSNETLKTDFFSNVSHEFKTPLAVIYNNAQLLQKSVSADSEQADYVDNILYSTKRLSNLIQNMLKLNKLEKQTIQPMPETYDVCAQLCDCIIQFDDNMEKKNIDFEADMEDEAYICADPGLMELVWNNLMSNALKFTPDGGKIRLLQKRAENYIQISVSDNGCGMDSEVMKHIFDKFYQGDTSHATYGNGLGLALVKRVLELGGNLNEDIVRECGVVEWVSVDPMKEDYISKDRVYKCYKMPLLDFKLLEGHFDCVYSSNALEHVNNLRQCLMYIYNSLKPSGGFFAHFGPIWSAPDGHHLENVKLKDGTIDNIMVMNTEDDAAYFKRAESLLKQVLQQQTMQA